MGEFIANLSGDQFCIVSADVADNDVDIGCQLERLQAIVNQCTIGAFDICDHQLYIEATMGAAVIPHDGVVEDLLVEAEMALHLAKSHKQGNVLVFEPQMAVEASDRHALERDLRDAIDNNQLTLLLQPQVDAESGTILGCEALLRWYHPERGAVPPQQFIPVAEESGLIHNIGDWVLSEACRILSLWNKSGRELVPIAVNISAMQFQHFALVDRVKQLLEAYGLQPEWLELEVTETVSMDEFEEVCETLQRLSDLGVKLAMDDFGTGYSSLSYLRQFPLDKLKIDRAFIKDVDSGGDRSIARFISALAKEQGLKIVAEGVETPAQLAFCQSLDCDLIQGFLFSKPLTTKQFSKCLANGRMLPGENTE